MNQSARITEITDAYVRTYTDNKQVIAYVEWVDNKGATGRTEGRESNGHMIALLLRAKREGVTVRRETW